jgi:hypothetical protein
MQRIITSRIIGISVQDAALKIDCDCLEETFTAACIVNEKYGLVLAFDSAKERDTYLRSRNRKIAAFLKEGSVFTMTLFPDYICKIIKVEGRGCFVNFIRIQSRINHCYELTKDYIIECIEKNQLQIKSPRFEKECYNIYVANTKKSYPNKIKPEPPFAVAIKESHNSWMKTLKTYNHTMSFESFKRDCLEYSGSGFKPFLPS